MSKLFPFLGFGSAQLLRYWNTFPAPQGEGVYKIPLSFCVFSPTLIFLEKENPVFIHRQEEIDRYKSIFLMHSASTPSDHFGWLRLENPGTAINTVFVCLIKTDLCHCWRFLSSPRGYRGTGRKKQNPFTYYNPHRADLWKSKKEQGHTMGIES